MKQWIERQFHLSECHTTVKKELVAGVTTFVTMAYVLAVIPNMLGAAGMEHEVVLTATVLLIIVTSCAMGLYTNRPFVLAPGLGSVGIVSGMLRTEGISPEIAAGIIFWSGILFIMISFLGLREAVVKVIPASLKHAISAGIGLFIALLGAKNCGLIVAVEAKNSLAFADLTSPSVILCIIGFLILLILRVRQVPGNMILAILSATVLGIPMGVTELPTGLFSMPADLSRQFLQVDFVGSLKFAYLPFLIALFIPDFFSTFGTVIGVGAKAGYLDENGNLAGVDKCFQVDALATSFGALFGIPSMTTYLESSAGVEAGGRTGMVAVFAGICFGIALFFSPIALMIPAAATSPVLIFIGIHMLQSMKNINYEDITEYFPAFLCIAFTVFANNIANGICIALPVYLLLKLVAGKRKELSPVMCVWVAICFLYLGTLI